LAFSKTVVQRSNINSAVNIACKFKCNISKSKLVLSECNDLYFFAIAFIAFTLHEIKQYPAFFWDTRYIYVFFICLVNISVVSNDGMYGNDKKFIAEVHKIISTVVEEILRHLQTLSGTEVRSIYTCIN
jgi:hypothetical protein